MANSPDINKTQLVVRIERSLKLQVERSAEQQNITTTALVNRILMEELSHVELTPRDYRQIAEDIEAEGKKRRGLVQDRPKDQSPTRKNGKSRRSQQK
jgi:hypothetical protein